MKKRITVTAADIENGQSWVFYSCPIALAVSRTLGCYVQVYSSLHIYNSKQGTYQRVALPKKADQFISDFDRGIEVKPFSFYIHI